MWSYGALALENPSSRRARKVKRKMKRKIKFGKVKSLVGKKAQARRAMARARRNVSDKDKGTAADVLDIVDAAIGATSEKLRGSPIEPIPYEEEEPASPLPWILGGLGAVVVIGGVIYFATRG